MIFIHPPFDIFRSSNQIDPNKIEKTGIVELPSSVILIGIPFERCSNVDQIRMKAFICIETTSRVGWTLRKTAV
jgi:hypothetical protein